MANNENLIPFNKRTESEQREIRSAGGKASGVTRRRKADFRKTLNLLLTAEVDLPEWQETLQTLGLDCTLEAAVNAAMIREALAGNVKAYLAIKDVIGQTSKSDEDLEKQDLEIQKLRAELEKQQMENKILRNAVSENNEESEDDGFLDALKGTAGEDWADEDEKETETGV